MEKAKSDYRRTMNARFDITENEVTRVGKFYLVSKVAQIGNYGGGPRLKSLARAFVVHYFGKILGWLLIFFEDQIRMVIRKIRRPKSP